MFSLLFSRFIRTFAGKLQKLNDEATSPSPCGNDSVGGTDRAAGRDYCAVWQRLTQWRQSGEPAGGNGRMRVYLNGLL